MPPKGPACKPQLLVCYLCGQQFGTSSLKIHVPQCYAKKLAQWEAGDPATRGKKPRDPASIDLEAASAPQNRDEFNDQQFKQFTADMEQCENCGRKFLPDRLVVHQRSCKPGGGSKPVGKASTTPPKLQVPAPPAGRAQSSGRPAGSSADAPSKPPPPSGLGARNGGGAAPSGALPPKLRALRQILFDDADSNADGVIDLGELRRLVREIEDGCTDDDVDALMRSLDLNKDGVISRDEWEAAQGGAKSGGGGGGGKGKARGPLANRKPAGMSSVKERVCGRCGTAEHDPAARFCASCGTPLTVDDEVARCGGCSAVLPYNARFCPECGERNDDEDGGDDGDEDGGAQGMEIVACPMCGNGCESTARHCDECGAPMDAGSGAAEGGDMICEPCGEIFSADSRFCEECGGELVALATSAKAQKAPPVGSAAKWARQTRMDLPPVDRTTHQGHGGSDADDAAADDDDDPSSPPRKSYTIPEDAAPPADNGEDDREPCDICGRRFLPDVLPRHRGVCEKQASKRRRVFDSSKARVQGTELAQHQRKAPPPPAPKSDWKAKSQAFRESMKAARQADKVLKAGGTAKDLPPPTYSDNSHLTPCPHCGRRFNPDVAERHIPKCQNTINKPKPPPKLRR